MNNLTGDPELKAMGQVLDALAPLEPAVQARVLQWVIIKLAIGFQIEGPPVGSSGSALEHSRTRRPSREGTVSAVAIKLGADSCRTLMIAAAAHLSLYQGRDSFTRHEWISCARDARAWKADYNQQLPTIVTRLLTSGFVFEKAKDVYSVTDKELEALEAKLADE